MSNDRGIIIPMDLSKMINEPKEHTWTRDGEPLTEGEELQVGDVDEDGWVYRGSVQCKDRRLPIEKQLNPENKKVGELHQVTIYPGDKIEINGARVVADKTVTLSTYAPSIRRIPAPGMADLPETDLRISTMWDRRNGRVPMEPISNLRCPCGSAYTRKSETHHSCQHCGRVWENETVATAVDKFWSEWTTNDNPW